MKTSLRIFSYRLLSFLCLFLSGATLFAQDEGSTSQTTVVHTSTTNTATPDMWYMQPWVWVAAGAVVLLLIVLLARGNNGNHQEVTRTTKVTTDIKNS